MAGTMYDYLVAKTPDYTTTTLSIRPSNQMDEDGGDKVKMNESDSGALESITLSGNRTFSVPVEWEVNLADSNTIMDMYWDPNKGASGARTFKWAHPIDGHIYTVRFVGKVPRTTTSCSLRVIKATLLVEGYVS